ncbi:hypothetical protein CTI12_AA561960 [Artemisia annua]|uniref:Uncharacterized protein n=1 Tax=Artemisia annua TaxID=35608 RepID=A0A2U1KUT8_ARTAN|nr:hypothetical protein CTI12_AA561960 [Artemisia annua]
MVPTCSSFDNCSLHMVADFFVIGITNTLHHQTFTSGGNDISRPPVVGNRRSSATKRRRVSNEACPSFRRSGASKNSKARIFVS